MEKIHIDFVIELLEENGYRITMTCEDCFKKIVVLVPFQESNDLTVAFSFLAEVVSCYSLPVTIISDRGPRL